MTTATDSLPPEFIEARMKNFRARRQETKVEPRKINYALNFSPIMTVLSREVIAKGMLGYSKIQDDAFHPWMELEVPAGVLDNSKYPILIQYELPRPTAEQLREHASQAIEATFKISYALPHKAGSEYGVVDKNAPRVNETDVQAQFRDIYGRMIRHQLPAELAPLFKGLEQKLF